MEDWVVGVIVAVIVCLIAIPLAYNIFHRFQAALPNEWLLLIKDGSLRKCGVGISVFRGLNETVVRFPSLLNKVSFSAQQVSKEMQGVELSGFIVWVINRDEQGPLKAYKHIKDISNLSNASDVTLHIKSMAESIVRHQIANLSIHEVISQRKKVRDGIRGGMQEILTSWGIWLETVEITDVKILSGSLFNDLQQPFRSSTQQMAEKIRIDTNHDLQTKRVMTQSKMTQLKNEKEVEQQIERSKMRLKQEEAEQKLVEQREEIKRSDIVMKQKTSILQFQSKEEIKRADIEMRQKTQILDLQSKLQVQKEKLKGELEVQKQKELMQTEGVNHELKIKQMRYGFEMKKVSDKYEVDAKMTDVNMQKEILSTVENVYRSMNVDSMKIVNFGQNQGLEHGIGKMAMALREVGSQLDQND